jgi:hypothetical protein
MRGRLERLLRNRRPLATAVALSAFVLPAQAQTWTGNRTTPRANELVAIDATGEAGWLYGAEDVAGDGLDAFRQQEQSIDLRTAYAAADSQRFWARVYVSDPNTVSGNIAVFVFLDSDDNANTGGTANATELAAAFDTDPTPGGYDFVLGLDGNETVSGVWAWNSASDAYEALDLQNNAASAEAGSDLDPVRLNGTTHGYLQGVVDLDVVGLTAACQANVYVRSVDGTGATADGDLDVGQFSACHPADNNDDGVPDAAEPDDRCAEDDQCPAGGLCVNGRCVYPRYCDADGDCAADESCIDGRCVADGGDACTSDAMCDGLVCQDGECSACTADSMCAAGRCGPDGRCTSGTAASNTDDGTELGPDEEVQGGALTCAARSSRPYGQGGALGALLLATLGALLVWRHQRG